MDYFSLFIDGLCLIGQSVMHIVFVNCLTGRKQKMWYFAIYLFLLCVMEWLFIKSGLSGASAISAELLALYGVSRLALRNQRSVSWAAAIFAVYISQLSFGVTNSAEDCQMPYVGLLLFPGLFFFAAELYILQTSYSVLPSSFSPGEAGKHSALLFLQVLGLGALLCTLYAYQYFCRSLQVQAALSSLTQAAQAQKAYIAEAQMRYEQTKAFRHDIKNHLSVLNGLLNGGELEEGKAYLPESVKPP